TFQPRSRKRPLMAHWITDSVVYHLYPLGCFGAPTRNDFNAAPVPRLAELHDWLDYLQDLGVNTLLLGPLFESSTHGYDTAVLLHLDRRLGTDETLSAVAGALSGRGMRLLLDGVFHHVGRAFLVL